MQIKIEGKKAYAYGLYLKISDMKELTDNFEREQADVKVEVVIEIGNVKKEMTFKEFLSALSIEAV